LVNPLKISFLPKSSGGVTIEGFIKGNSIGDPIHVEVKKVPLLEFEIPPADSAVVGVPVTFKLKPGLVDPGSTLDIKV
jgi:hypothetical protein